MNLTENPPTLTTMDWIQPGSAPDWNEFPVVDFVNRTYFSDDPI
jgi:hypothetical protein